jgi:single-stranded DNA-binding protein
MFNQVFLVGRLEDVPDLSSKSDQAYETKVYLQVSKPYDAYDNRHNYVRVPIYVWRGMAKKIVSSAKAGSYVAIKGRLCNQKDVENDIIIEGESIRVLDYDFAHLKE